MQKTGAFLLLNRGETMRNKSLFKQFAAYASLSVLGMIGMSCYILADTFFVSKGLGTNGLAALNLAIPVYNVIHGVGLMLGIGGATRYSVCKSRKEEGEANAVFTDTLYLAAVFSLFFVLAGAIFSEQIAHLLGADQQTISMTNTYLKVLLLFSPAFLLNDVLICFTRNDGAPRLAMLATLAGSFSNIVLDYVFIFPCRMGMFGAVFATGLAPVIGVGVSVTRFLRKKSGFHAAKTLPQWRHIRSNFALGFPSFVEQLSSAVVMIAFNAIILDLLGNVGVAAYGVVANISLVVLSVFTGIAQGTQPLVSRAHGESLPAKCRALLLFSVLSSILFAVLVYIVIFVFARPIAEIFNSEGNAEMGKIAANGLRLYFIAAPFAGINAALCSFFAAMEKPLPAHLLSLLRGLIVILPAALLCSSLWGITGVWLSFPFTEALVAAVGAILIVLLRKKLFSHA